MSSELLFKVKRNLTENLQTIIKRMQFTAASTYTNVIESSDVTSSLCYVIEALFLTGLKSSYANKMVMDTSINRKVPAPTFWDFVQNFTHKLVVQQLSRLSFIISEVGLCRAWVRLALNDGLLSSYFTAILDDEKFRKKFYTKDSYWNDQEQVTLMMGLIQGVDSLEFRLPYNVSLLNSWGSTPLELSGIIQIASLPVLLPPDEVTKKPEPKVVTAPKIEPAPAAAEEVEFGVALASPDNELLVTKRKKKKRKSKSRSVADSASVASADSFTGASSSRKNSAVQRESRLASREGSAILDNSESTTTFQEQPTENISVAVVPEIVSSESTVPPLVSVDIKDIINEEVTKPLKPLESGIGCGEVVSDKAKEMTLKANIEDAALVSYTTEARVSKKVDVKMPKNSKDNITKKSEPKNGKRETTTVDDFFISGFVIDDEDSSHRPLSQFSSDSVESPQVGSPQDVPSYENHGNINEETEIRETRSRSECLLNENKPVLTNDNPDPSLGESSNTNLAKLLRADSSGWSNTGLSTSPGFAVTDTPSQLSTNTETSLVNSFQADLARIGVLDLYQNTSNNVNDSPRRSNHSNDGFEVLPSPSSVPIANEMRTIYTLLTLEKGLGSQDYFCKSCNCPIGTIYGKFKVCAFDSAYYCSLCHADDESVIPAKIVHNWDFTLYKVSSQSKTFLTEMESEPLIDFEFIDNNLYEYIPQLLAIYKKRLRLKYAANYLFSCKEEVANSVRHKIWPKEYMLNSLHLYSVHDLTQIQSGHLSIHLTKVIDFCINHILNCSVCKLKGFICEVCKSPGVIYAFDLEYTTTCPQCSAVFHKHCKTEYSNCPKCVRMTSYSINNFRSSSSVSWNSLSEM